MTQTTPPARVIIIDNSNTPSLEIESGVIERAGFELELIRMPAPGNIAEIRNTALHLCSTPLIASLDADVMPAPDWLEMMVESIEPHCHCLTSRKDRVCAVGGRTMFLSPPDVQPDKEDSLILDQGDVALENPRCIYSGNALFKREALENAGGYPLESLDPDLALAEKIYANGDVMLYMPSIKCAKIHI
jgi:hypothetical protein